MKSILSFLFIWITLNATAADLITDKPVYEFTSGIMRGFVRPLGHYHGLVIYGPNNIPITRLGGCTINLEHYVAADKMHGQFVPRDKVKQSYETAENSITIHFEPYEEWKIHSSLKFDFSSDDYIDAEFTFTFGQDYEKFEAFIASYMHSRVPPLLKMNGEWIRLQPEGNWQMFLPKTKQHGELVMDGRWDWFPDWLEPHVVNEVYDIPVIVTRDEDNPFALIQMIDPSECMALSPNNFAPAHDFSLIGRDVKAGETVKIPVRLVYKELKSMNEIEELYRTFLADHEINLNQ